jgi:hypothetical protein
VLLLVPCDPLNARAPDEHFEPEATAARESGLDVALVDHDALLDPSTAASALRRVPPSDDAVYRGWMLRSEQYAEFVRLAAHREVRLRTDAGAYKRVHELPGWFAAFASFTPASVWTKSASVEEFDNRCRELGTGSAVLRDYVKSMKHYWTEAAFIPALEDLPAARRVAARFLDLRGDDFVGGIVVRRFEEFTTAEVRTWWFRGRCKLVTAHPDSPEAEPPPDLDTSFLNDAVRLLDSPFVTVDLVRRADGQWRVIEAGDGQVSDRPASLPPLRLLEALATSCL